ncbi:MAG TPA: aspartate kinase [Longimicrobiales bacterium]|nr:aspartate kinase [Longimicrobiales bacterium]
MGAAAAPLVVEKYGGTSVGDAARIRRIAERAARLQRNGSPRVVVVSAMGHATDELLALAAGVSGDPFAHPRELDMLLTAGERISMALLAMAIEDAGGRAISLTGSQAAIITDDRHTGARIREVRADRVREELEAGRVVIVAGFQGVSVRQEVTTLGRGGSDTTAVALAAALGAARCDIFTDVEGVFTADPRRAPGARLLKRVSYDDMTELAASGAQVLHPRAVEVGARFGIPVRVAAADAESEEAGTLIAGSGSIEGLSLTGLASEAGYAQLVLRGMREGPRTTARLLVALADAGISVDMVAHADRPDGLRQIQVSVREASLDGALGVCQAALEASGGERIDTRRDLARVTLVGSGMHDRPGVYATAYDALYAADIEVLGVSTSSVSISLLVPADRRDETLALLHAAFHLSALEAEGSA